MLSPLQDRVAHIVAELAEAEDFALAGGAALIIRGDVDRRTRDLDFFDTSALAVDRLVPGEQHEFCVGRRHSYSNLPELQERIRSLFGD